MIAVLLNAKLISNGDGYVRKISLDFFQATRHKNHLIMLQPGMSREEVAASLRKTADEVQAAECATLET